MIATVGAPAIAAAPSAQPSFVYCSAISVSPRAPGLIVTSVFRARSDPQFVRSVFTNFLRSSYAPYGNGWIFQEAATACNSFKDRKEAEKRRRVDIARVPQPPQTIFNVTFVMQ